MNGANVNGIPGNVFPEYCRWNFASYSPRKPSLDLSMSCAAMEGTGKPAYSSWPSGFLQYYPFKMKYFHVLSKEAFHLIFYIYV